MRGGRTTAILVLFMIVLGMGLITVYYMYKTVSTVHNMISMPTWLAKEIGNKYVLVTQAFDLKPGQVYQVTATKNGWQIMQKDTKLYDILTLKNIDISLGDVFAPHLWNLHIPLGGSNYVRWQFSSELWSANQSYTLDTIITPLQYTAQNFPRFFKISNDVVIHLDIHHNSDGVIWAHAPGRDMGAGLKWGSTTRLDLEYYYGSSTDILFTSYVNGTKYQRWPASYYNSGPTRISIGDGISSPEFCIAYLAIYNPNTTTIPSSLTGYIIDSRKLKVLIDPTFYNGSAFFDIVSGNAGIPYGNVYRVLADTKWLWHISDVKNDNKVHFMYFPEGTIVKILDQSGNIVRQFTITGTLAGNTTQVLDYDISLPVTTLPDVTVEAYVPAQEIRVYGPPGSYVEIVADGVVYGAKEIPYYGYVDLNLTEPLDNAYIVVYADDKTDNVNIDLKDLGGGKYKVTVSNSKGIVLPNMLVLLRDPSNAVVAYGVTDDSGTVTLDVGHPLPSVTVEVHGIFEDKLYQASKEFTLATTENAQVGNVQTSEQSSLTRYALVGLGAFIIIVAVVIVATRRR